MLRERAVGDSPDLFGSVRRFAHGDGGVGLRAASAARLVDDMPWSDESDPDRDSFEVDVRRGVHGDDGEGLRVAPAVSLVDDMPWSDESGPERDGFDVDVGPFAHGDDGEGLRAAPAAGLVDDMPWLDGDDDGGWTDEAAPGAWGATGDVERFAASCAERRPRAARRQRRRLQTQGVDLPADAWKRFTPDVVDAKRCQARTWAGGRGDQCKSRFLPGRLLCGEHERHSWRREGLTHGFVTGRSRAGRCCSFCSERSRGKTRWRETRRAWSW